MDRLRAIAAKIIADYKEHYDFPWQGESHMEDCIMANLQSLSQEAVRDEAISIAYGEQAREFFHDGLSADLHEICKDKAEAYAMGYRDACLEIGDKLKALKREPNAAGQAGRQLEPPLRGDVVGPAPAAPDVASMVKRLENGEIQVATMYEGEWVRDVDMAREIATLLAQLGQGWIPVYDEESKGGAFLTGIPGKPIYALDERGGPQLWYRFDLPLLPPAPGASDE